MSKLLIDREGLAHELWAAAQLAPGEGIADGVARLAALLAQPVEVEVDDVVAWLVEKGRTWKDRTYISESSAVKACDERQDCSVVSPLVRQSDSHSALSAVTAERDAARDALRAEQDRYQRDVYGLNNEGDPIGGEPAGGYANDNAKLRAEVEAMRKVKTAPALHAAVGAIYFDDSSDFVSALWEVVRSLAPELVDELESNPSAVWHKTEAMAAKEGV